MENIVYELKHARKEDYFKQIMSNYVETHFHRHRCYEVMLVQKGVRIVRIEKQEYTVTAGDIILVKPNQVHSLNTKEEGYGVICLFSPELISRISSHLTEYELKSPVVRNVPKMYSNLLTQASDNMNIAQIKCVVYGVISLFYDQLDLEHKVTKNRGNQLLDDILSYVEHHIGSTCSVQDLSEHLGYTATYLSNYFSVHVGITYFEYVRDAKISHACYLLGNTTLTVQEIMGQCGYVSSSSFNRNFREVMGCSPTEYRGRTQRYINLIYKDENQ